MLNEGVWEDNLRHIQSCTSMKPFSEHSPWNVSKNLLPNNNLVSKDAPDS